MTSNTNEGRTFDTFQRESKGRSSVSAFLTSVNASPTKEYDSRSRSGKVPRAKRPRSSCGRSITNERDRGRGKMRKRSVHGIASRTDTVRTEQEKEEEEEELARISGSSSGESDSCPTIAVNKTLLNQCPTKHKQDMFDASRTGTVASFLRANPSRHQLVEAGQHGSSASATRRIGTAKQPPSRGRRRRGLARKSDFGTSELDLVDTSSDSDNDKVEPAVLCPSGYGAVQQGRKEKETGSGALKMALPTHPYSDTAFAEAPSRSVASSNGQVVVGGGGMDMSVFVQSVQQLGEEEDEGAPARESEEEQILTSDSLSSAGESPSRTEQRASEWLRGQHLDTPGNEMDASATPSKFESAKKKTKFVRGGLAERLRRLVLREASDISFWEHSCRQGGKGACDSSQDTPHQPGDRSNSITVEVTFVTHCCSLFIADCIVRSSSGREALPCGGGSAGGTLPDSANPVCTSDTSQGCQVGEEIKVVFTPRSARFVRLGSGSQVQIFPPWYWVDVSSGNAGKVLIGAHFSCCVLASEEPVCHPDTKKGSLLLKDPRPKKLFD